MDREATKYIILVYIYIYIYIKNKYIIDFKIIKKIVSIQIFNIKLELLQIYYHPIKIKKKKENLCLHVYISVRN